MKKKAISIRLDPEILDWFRSEFPDGYQVGIQKVLKEHMQAQEQDLYIRTGRAQQLFHDYYAQCFWHLKKDLQITPDLIPIVAEGLRKHGGRIGWELASELEQ